MKKSPNTTKLDVCHDFMDDVNDDDDEVLFGIQVDEESDIY